MPLGLMMLHTPGPTWDYNSQRVQMRRDEMECDTDNETHNEAEALPLKETEVDLEEQSAGTTESDKADALLVTHRLRRKRTRHN